MNINPYDNKPTPPKRRKKTFLKPPTIPRDGQCELSRRENTTLIIFIGEGQSKRSHVKNKQKMSKSRPHLPGSKHAPV